MMKRGPVIHRVVLVPMQIYTQQEEDKTIAVMPGWILPAGITAEGKDIDDAVSKLRGMMSDYWDGRKK